MYAVAAVLSRPNLQNLARLVATWVAPLYSSHSAHARDCRDSQSTRQYFLEASKSAYMGDLLKVVGLLGSVQDLGFV
eukprot:8883229-Lingulodinium_polyedra.AAC.1